MLYPRAGTLGGCTAHNALITVTPQAMDWDTIAELTKDLTWRSENMYKYFARLERCGYVSAPGSIDYIAKGLWWSAHALLRRLKGWNDWSHGHGFDGWLSTERFDLKRVFTDPDLRKIIFNTLTIVVRLKIGSMINRAITRFDPNDLRNSENSPEGLALTPLSTADGKRNGPREYVVKTERERPDRLQVRKNTLVTKIIFDGKRAVGVEAREGDYLYGASPMPKTEVFNVSAYETIGRVEGGRISGSL
jgi:choline dehydrogenase